MTTLTFDEADAVDIGGIDDPLASLLGKPPRFRMTRTRITQGHMRIDFCRIVEKDWCAIVVAFGDAWTASPQNSGPYTAEMDDGAGTSETIEIAMHPWRSRWRWQNRPWPFPPIPLEDLYQAKLLPRFDPALTHGSDTYWGPYVYEPLGLAGLTAYMPMTGGRGDIGIVTSAQGYYLCHPDNAQAYADVMAQGEGGASFPWDFFDPATGCNIDPIIQYPRAGVYADYLGANPALPSNAPIDPMVEATISGPPGTKLSWADPPYAAPSWCFVNSSDSPPAQLRIPANTTIDSSGKFTAYMEQLGGGNRLPTEPMTVVTSDSQPVAGVTAKLTGNMAYGSGMTLDTAHQPACSYLPYLLTGDPYFLETLQCQATFCVIENGSAPPEGGLGTQARACGWTARTLSEAAKVTPDNPPSWLQRREIWQTAIEQWEVTWRAQTIDHPDQSRQAVHILMSDPSWNQYVMWQEDIGLQGLSLCVFLHPETKWIDDVKWLVNQAMDRCDDKGWPKTMPTCYSSYVRGDPGTPMYYWDAQWEASKASFGMTEPPTEPQYHASYWGHLVNGLSLAWQAGATECEPALRYINGLYPDGIAQRKLTREGQCAVAGPA